MVKHFPLFMICFLLTGCRTFTNTQLEQEQWKYYKQGFHSGVNCRSIMSSPLCEIFLEHIEEME